MKPCPACGVTSDPRDEDEIHWARIFCNNWDCAVIEYEVPCDGG